jgi:hypothetical protein
MSSEEKDKKISFSVFLFGSGRLLKAEIDWYRGPYSSSSGGGGGETPGDLTESRVSAMAALLEIQPDHQLNTAIVLLGRSCAQPSASFACSGSSSSQRNLHPRIYHCSSFVYRQIFTSSERKIRELRIQYRYTGCRPPPPFLYAWEGR